MKKCENCGIEHDGSYGSGRFCSIKCAKSFSTRAKRKEINEKISKSIKRKLYNGETVGFSIPNSFKEKRYCKQCGKELSNNTRGNYCKKCNYSRPEYRKKLSNSLKGKSGGYRKGAGRTKGGYYKELYFDSPFEIEIAKKLDELNISWKRNTKRFYFQFKGEKKYYIPDFFINEEFYLETKGYWYGDKEEKTNEAVKQNKLNWKCIMWKDWKKDNSILEKLIKNSL